MNIRLSDHFSSGRLLRFALPSIVMMIFTSIYGVVDGFFISNFVGKTPFAAVNLIIPALMILGSLGFMFGAGGSALIAKTMGEGDEKKANELFSMLVAVLAAVGCVLAVVCFFFIEPIARLLGADEAMIGDCVIYARIQMLSLPLYMLQYEFQSFCVTAEKPQLGLVVTVASGVTNMVLDALFMAVFHWGVAGASIATAISQAVGGLLPLIFFARKNDSRLRLTRFKMDFGALVKNCTNGSSELMSNISMSIVSMLYNLQLMRYAGENGVAAYGVLMYVNMIFLATFIGYSTGIAPIIGYHFGARNQGEVQGILRRSMAVIGCFAVAMFAAAIVLARPLASIFVGYDESLMALTVRAFGIYSFSFLFSGFAIFGSSFFTALNDGLTSALISFLRSLLFQVAAVLIFPLIWGIDGVWLSIVAAELVAAAVTMIFIAAKRKTYGY